MDIKYLTRLYYALIGIAASLGFFLLLYWALRLNSSISTLIAETYATPLYFWPYVILTLGTVILFGVNAALFAYRWRKYGPPKIKGQSGTGIGSLAGIAASACPVCGSTILSAIGIAGGLAALPLQGLELKVLSFALVALPVWLTSRELKRFACGGDKCPLPRDHSFTDADGHTLAILLAAVLLLVSVNWNLLKSEPLITKALSANATNAALPINELLNEITAKVLPEKGYPSKIRLGDSVLKLVDYGVIDREKFVALYRNRKGIPPELKTIFDEPSNKPILLTRENANYYINLLWPIGLANHMSANEKSPVNSKSLFNFASTGGWNLGKKDNGGEYFNKFEIVPLTPAQEALVVRIAQAAYRPCCNNSTFFQDCNHGSALLGLLELGAAQGLSETDLWHEALAFNSFWFPDNYIETALYFKTVKNISWENVDPKIVMGKDYSSISGWYANVDKEIKRLNLMPLQRGSSGCGV